MIKPDRHSDPKISVINISAYILKELNKFYGISYDELLKKTIETLGEKAKENFPYALNFLFLLGKLKYIEQSDSFKYNATK
ncbi:ABC-three component system middle component 8 [Marinifilum fragile]|uniref:ABC-three component system middle component 8 n=1 Tax=Marinifilum fragile TaxID=570161 RepID=UPI002AA7D401|nr:ABC-three component system middle component 8 [Marinifilum fragile]